MDPQRQRIQEDLRGLVHGDVRCDDIFLELYSSDSSIYQIRPLGVVRPRTTEDVAAVLRYAHAQRIPVHARGAGTGLAGESLGPGLVIDFSRYMRRLLHTDGDTVRIQPGLVHARLNEQLRPLEKIFGPDPAMSQVTTMGSVIAIDASGSHWLAYGSARRHVRSLEVALADGTILELGREPIPNAPLPLDASPAQMRRHDLIVRLAELLDREEPAISRFQPRTLVNRSGYHLAGIWDWQAIDLAKLICGSEGTLALITAATLDVQPLPKYKVAALVCFESLDLAVQAVPELLTFGPCALDMLDRRHLSLAREADPRFNPLVPFETEGLLLIEFAGDSLRELQDQLRQATDFVWKQKRLAFEVRIAADIEELRFFWRLARRVMPTLQRVRGAARPIPFVEDVAVPPEALGDFLVRMQNTLKRHQVTASLYGHVGHGQLHIRPFLDLQEPSDLAKLDALAVDLYDETLAVGGTISGEHGDGLTRTPFIRKQYGELYAAFQAVKLAFDPENILNPGKIVSSTTQSLTEHLRSGFATPPPIPPGALQTHGPILLHELAAEIAAAGSNDAATPEAPSNSAATSSATLPAPSENPPTALPLFELQLNWSQQDVLQEARSCNGCGICRTQLADHRMCPIFRVGPGEEASPRAKANLLRGVLTGQLSPELLKRDELKGIADLCVNCQQCRFECPAGVDIPKLMIEAKAAYVANNGLRISDWLTVHVDWVAQWAGRFPAVANWALGNRQARWVLEKVLGLAHNRKLPRVSRQSFTRWAARRRLTRPLRRGERKVLYLADTYVNYFDPQLGQALVSVLEHHSVNVYVPPEPFVAGMALITAGALDAARRLAAANITQLAEAVRQGYTIVATEPAAVLALTRFYPELVDDDDARLVAGRTVEACDYLWRLHEQGELQFNLNPIHAVVGYHAPCHAKALNNGSPAENLLRLIAGLQVIRLEKGCSGMAGTFGLSKNNFRTSLRAGWGLISAMREGILQAGATECSTCKMQMEQGADKPTIHPLKWLALSYGLMPELQELLQPRGSRKYVS